MITKIANDLHFKLKIISDFLKLPKSYNLLVNEVN